MNPELATAIEKGAAHKPAETVDNSTPHNENDKKRKRRKKRKGQV